MFQSSRVLEEQSQTYCGLMRMQTAKGFEFPLGAVSKSISGTDADSGELWVRSAEAAVA